MPEPNDEDRWSLRNAQPYSVGLLLATGAVRDARLFMDSPRCAYLKVPFVQGNHDWRSTLAVPGELPRVTTSAVSPLAVIRGREDEIEAELATLAARDDTAAVLFAAMPMALVTAVDAERLCRVVAERHATPVVCVPGRRIGSDWLVGYAEAMEALARGLPLRPAPAPGRVAVVGYLHDRNEGDHRGNHAELRRIVRGLGLELVSTWFDGGPVRDLARVAEAGTIVSLPYGRAAARRLARRTGAKLVQADLPFGLPATLRLVHDLAAATGRAAAARAFVAAELAAAAPPLEAAIQLALVHRRVAYVGDPHLLVGFLETARLLGCRVPFAAVTNEARHRKELDGPAPDALRAALPAPERARLGCGDDGARVVTAPAELLVFPRRSELTRRLREALANEEMDAVVAHGDAALPEGLAGVELGFPSYSRHALLDRPFLGFRGALAFAEDLAVALRHAERAAIESARAGQGTRSRTSR